MKVTHLECSLTGERYEAGKPHNLSRAGRPLFVRYDMDAAKRTLTRESLGQREPGMWKWRELLPNDGEPVSLGIAGDRLEDIEGRLRWGLGCDLVMSSAGVSVGEHDFVKDALARLGAEQHLWLVDMRPGKPIAFSTIPQDGKAALCAWVSGDLNKNLRAGDIMKQLAPIVGGGGGGKPDLAMAGGKLGDKVPEAIAKAREVVSALIG